MTIEADDSGGRDRDAATPTATSVGAAARSTARSEDADEGVAEEYAAALAALADRGRFGVRLGLGRTRALLRELGDPQLAVRGALIAGTNGKGSVLALTGSALRAAGLRVGETPKPHLTSYRERLQIDGRPVDPGTFSRLVRDAIRAADRVARRLGDPTEFELLTAVVFAWFAEQDIDLAIVEVGLGGRLDATHAWDGGVAAITNVDLDHTERLGPTVAHIAREKAAIIVRGDRAVTGATGVARDIIRRRASRLRVPLAIVEPAPIVAIDRGGLELELPRLGRTRVGLLGRHQAANVAVADAVLDALGEAGIAAVPDHARRRGYAAARWPGRLELLSVDGRDVLLDGAHNPAGAAALAAALDDLRPHLTHGRLTLVLACMADKDVAGIAAALGRSAALDGALVVTTAIDTPRALPAGRLAAIWLNRSGRVGSVEVEPDLDRALDRALAGPPGPVVVAGSLYLVGAVRSRLVDEPLLRDPMPLLRGAGHAVGDRLAPGDNRPR
ncbi:MAG TPA: cyanophycin synthetase [Candidatus Limnocylindrales bacterium]|nr:cyanophycin synthetase [Candidatus Limnocylindrales bacterium]